MRCSKVAEFRPVKGFCSLCTYSIDSGRIATEEREMGWVKGRPVYRKWYYHAECYKTRLLEPRAKRSELVCVSRETVLDGFPMSLPTRKKNCDGI